MEDGIWTVIISPNLTLLILIILIKGILTFLADSFFLSSSVFHVCDLKGNKLTDENLIRYIEKVNCVFFPINHY